MGTYDAESRDRGGGFGSISGLTFDFASASTSSTIACCVLAPQSPTNTTHASTTTEKLCKNTPKFPQDSCMPYRNTVTYTTGPTLHHRTDTMISRMTITFHNFASAAMQDAPNHELARILRELAASIEDCSCDQDGRILRDYNGNEVGTVRCDQDAE